MRHFLYFNRLLPYLNPQNFFYNMRFAGVIVFILCSVGALAQDYIITSKADTLRGEVRILSYDQVERVQIEKDKKKEVFTALQVLSVFKDGAEYKPIRYDNRIILMQIIRSGYLSLFAFKIQGQNTYDGRFLTKLDGTSMEVPNIGFKKILSNYLNTCVEVSNKIKEGKFGRTEIDSIVDEFNKCMENATAVPMASGKNENDKTQAIDSFVKKVEAEKFDTKADALEMLNDIKSRASNNQNIPNYLLEGIKSSLGQVPALSKDLDELISLLKK